MTYTINGKEYTEFDINLRCAEIEGFKFSSDNVEVMAFDHLQSLITGCDEFEVYVPFTDWHDAGHIVDKCWDELIEVVDCMGHEITNDDIGWCKWSYLMAQHNCTKLVAACICYIEINEAGL
jgi:hypothetical protein